MKWKPIILWSLLVLIVYACLLPFSYFYIFIIMFEFLDYFPTEEDAVKGFLLLMLFNSSFFLFLGFIFRKWANPEKKPTVVRVFKILLAVNFILCLFLLFASFSEINNQHKVKWTGKELFLDKELADLPAQYELDLEEVKMASDKDSTGLNIEKTNGKIEKADIKTILDATKGFDHVLHIDLFDGNSHLFLKTNQSNELIKCLIVDTDFKKDQNASICGTSLPDIQHPILAQLYVVLQERNFFHHPEKTYYLDFEKSEEISSTLPYENTLHLSFVSKGYTLKELEEEVMYFLQDGSGWFFEQSPYISYSIDVQDEKGAFSKRFFAEYTHGTIETIPAAESEIAKELQNKK